MDSFAQTSSGCAEARAANARRSRGAAGRRSPQPRARRKVVARSAEEGPAVAAAAADVPRRRTAMPSSPERVGARGAKMRLVSKGERAASGCGLWPGSGDGAEKLILAVPTVRAFRGLWSRAHRPWASGKCFFFPFRLTSGA